MFLIHYSQMGGNRTNQQLPINILKRGPIKYISINYNQHKNFYNFLGEQIVDDFLDSVHSRFVSGGEYKLQEYAEIINQQQGDFLIAQSTRVWLTNNYAGRYFNNFIKNSIKREIVKRIIFNGLTGSSWHFKRFQRLSVIAFPVSDYKTLMSG